MHGLTKYLPKFKLGPTAAVVALIWVIVDSVAVWDYSINIETKQKTEYGWTIGSCYHVATDDPFETNARISKILDVKQTKQIYVKYQYYHSYWLGWFEPTSELRLDYSAYVEVPCPISIWNKIR